MATLVNIINHDKIFLNSNGQEVYPPGHSKSGVVKPASEQARNPNLPPKSLAEEKIHIDEEAQQAINLLKSKGLL